MKNFLRNYFTPSEQRLLSVILLIAFIGLLVTNKPFNQLYSDEVKADSIKAEIESPFKLYVDIGTASKEEIMQIKGIGPKIADKIISFRDSIEIVSNYDLLKINGIGEKGLDKWLPYLKPLPADSLHSNSSIIEKDNGTQDSEPIENKADINKATKEDIMKVKGIGSKKASQIIEYRDKKSGLKNMEELLSIKGIGKKTLAKIEELFYVGLINE